jgi:hypothetical protein
MAPVRAFALWIAALSGLAGCPAPPTALARAQQTALELNQDLRFGRMELVMDRVAPVVRETFAAQHRAWGGSVRVADIELTGFQPRNERALEVFVRVAWYRYEEQELRTTTLQQSWFDEDGWRLTGEKRLDGDVGLLGESVVYDRPESPPTRAQFPTVRLRGGVGSPSGENAVK